MKHLLNGTLLAGVVGCLLLATIPFGAITPEYAVPLYAVAVVLGLLWVAKVLLWKQVSWLRSPMHWAVAAFALYAAARYATSPVEYDSRLELFHVALYALIYFLVASNFWRQRDRSVVVVAVMVMAFAEVGYGLLQFGPNGSDLVLDADRALQYHGRASGTFICPNHLAGFLEVVLLLLLARIAVRPAGAGPPLQRRAVKALEVVVALVLVGGIVTTLSRGGWISTAAGFVVFAVWAWRAGAIAPRIAAAVLALLVVLGGAALSVPSVRDRVAYTVSVGQEDEGMVLKDVTLAGRTLMWTATLKMIPDQPVFGTGPLTWEWFHLKQRDPRLQMRPRYTHQDVLQLTSDYGLVGLALVMAIFGSFFWHAARLSRPGNPAEQRAFAIGSAAAVATIVVHSFVDFNMHIPANALLVVTIMGLTVAMDNGRAGERRRPMAPVSRIVLAAVLLALVGAGLRFGIPLVRSDRATSLGNALKEVLEWDAALEAYQAAIAADPGSPEPYAKTGDIYRAQGALASAPEDEAIQLTLAHEAIAAYDKSLELNPYQSEVMLRLASAHELAGDNVSALRTYQWALAVDPNNAFNYLRLGIFYRRIGEAERAAEAFQTSSDLGSRDQIAVVNIQDIRRRAPLVP